MIELQQCSRTIRIRNICKSHSESQNYIGVGGVSPSQCPLCECVPNAPATIDSDSAIINCMTTTGLEPAIPGAVSRCATKLIKQNKQHYVRGRALVFAIVSRLNREMRIQALVAQEGQLIKRKHMGRCCARSIAASYKLAMLATRVRSPACAYGSMTDCARLSSRVNHGAGHSTRIKIHSYGQCQFCDVVIGHCLSMAVGWLCV